MPPSLRGPFLAVVGCLLGAACGSKGGGGAVSPPPAADAAAADAGGSPPDAAAPAAERPAPDATPGGVLQVLVVARQTKVWIGERGERPVADNLSGAKVGAWVQAPPGQWQFRAGRGDAEGRAEVWVPIGPFLLQVGSTFIVSPAAQSFDLTYLAFGSPDRIAPATRPASLSLTLSGLAPWQAGDRLIFQVPALSEIEGFAHQKLLPVPAANVTTVSASGDFATFTDAALVDGPGRGDEVWIGQLAGVTSAAGTRYLTVRGVWQSKQVKMVDGQPTAITGALVTVPPPAQPPLAIDWPGPEYQAIVAEAAPTATKLAGELEILAAPGAERLGQYDWAGNVLVASFAETAARFEARAGDPYPQTWGRVARARAFYAIPAQLPGQPAATEFRGQITITDTVAGLTARPLRPLVAPVRNLQVNGQNAFTTQTGVTTTPRFTWSPPAIGVPSMYRAWVYRAQVEAGRVLWRTIATLMTAETSLQLPPELLEAGQSYAMVLDARVAEGMSVAAPYRFSTRSGRAAIWTGVFQP